MISYSQNTPYIAGSKLKLRSVPEVPELIGYWTLLMKRLLNSRWLYWLMSIAVRVTSDIKRDLCYILRQLLQPSNRESHSPNKTYECCIRIPIYKFLSVSLVFKNNLKFPAIGESHSSGMSRSAGSAAGVYLAQCICRPRSRRSDRPDEWYSVDARWPLLWSGLPGSPALPEFASPIPRLAHLSTRPAAASEACAPMRGQSTVAGAVHPKTACRHGCTSSDTPGAES